MLAFRALVGVASPKVQDQFVLLEIRRGVYALPEGARRALVPRMRIAWLIRGFVLPVVRLAAPRVRPFIGIGFFLMICQYLFGLYESTATKIEPLFAPFIQINYPKNISLPQRFLEYTLKATLVSILASFLLSSSTKIFQKPYFERFLYLSFSSGSLVVIFYKPDNIRKIILLIIKNYPVVDHFVRSQLGRLAIFMAATLFLRTGKMPSSSYFYLFFVYYFQIYQCAISAKNLAANKEKRGGRDCFIILFTK